MAAINLREYVTAVLEDVRQASYAEGLDMAKAGIERDGEHGKPSLEEATQLRMLMARIEVLTLAQAWLENLPRDVCTSVPYEEIDASLSRDLDRMRAEQDVMPPHSDGKIFFH